MLRQVRLVAVPLVLVCAKGLARLDVLDVQGLVRAVVALDVRADAELLAQTTVQLVVETDARVRAKEVASMDADNIARAVVLEIARELALVVSHLIRRRNAEKKIEGYKWL